MLRHQRIALDFDDVLFESSKPFWMYCREKGCGIPDWSQAQNNLSHLMACSKEEARQVIMDWTQGPWKDLHEIAPPRACIEALTKLCNAGAQLMVVTSRSEKDSELTRGYVDRFLSPWIRAIYYTQDKAKTCLELGCTVLIDDSPQQLEAVSKRGIEAVAFGRAPWTLRLTFNRCNSWSKLCDWLLVQVLVIADPDLCECLLRAGVSAANVASEMEVDWKRVHLWLRPDANQEQVWLCSKDQFRRWSKSQVLALFKPATLRWK